MPPGGLSHLLLIHLPGNLLGSPNIMAFNTRPSDTALVNSLCREGLLLLPFVSCPLIIHPLIILCVYIPREPLGGSRLLHSPPVV